MAAMLVRSLRGPGRFQGEIRVYARAIDEHLAGVQSIACVIPHQFQRHAMLDRVDALQLIDGSRFETVSGFDADILINKPIYPLLSNRSAVRYFEEPWQVYRNAMVGMYVQSFTPEECVRYADLKTINVGHFTVGGEVFDRFRRVYTETVDRIGLVDGADQAGFNAVIRRGEVPCEPYGQYDVCNCTQTEETRWIAYRLIHFAGYPDRLGRMQQCFDRRMERFQLEQGG